ncbi:CLUMA_CG020096, isoform A, partial [Clunio marinus]
SPLTPIILALGSPKLKSHLKYSSNNNKHILPSLTLKMEGIFQDIKPTIRSILLALGRITTERQFRSEYFNLEGESFNTVLRSVSMNFMEFMRLMPDICRVWMNNHEVVIQRVSSEETSHMDSLTIHGHKRRGSSRRARPFIRHYRQNIFPQPPRFTSTYHNNLENLSRAFPKHLNHKDIRTSKTITQQKNITMPSYSSNTLFKPNQNVRFTDGMFANRTKVMPENIPTPMYSTISNDVYHKEKVDCSYKFKNDAKTSENLKGQIISHKRENLDISDDWSDLEETFENIGTQYESPLNQKNETVTNKINQNYLIGSQEDDKLEKCTEKIQSNTSNQSSHTALCNSNSLTNSHEVLFQIRSFSLNEYQSNIADYITDFTKIPQPLVKKLNYSLLISICLTVIDSPSSFVFQLNSKEYQNMMTEMNIHYNNMKNDKELHIMKVLPEMFAAAIIDGTWYRVEILVVSLLKETVMARLVDIGITKSVEIKDLRHLHKKFSTSSQKSCKGSMFRVKPKHGSVWTSQAISFFREKIKSKTVFALINNYDGSIFELTLVDDVKEGSVITDVLVKSGYAEIFHKPIKRLQAILI